MPKYATQCYCVAFGVYGTRSHGYWLKIVAGDRYSDATDDDGDSRCYVNIS